MSGHEIHRGWQKSVALTEYGNGGMVTMRRRVQCLVSMTVILMLGTAVAATATQPVTVTVQFEVGESWAPAYRLIALHDEATDEGNVLALTWVPTSDGWFGSVWGIQLVSDTHVLPSRMARPGTGELEGLSVIQVAPAEPQPGHRYEAALSYDPRSGVAAARVMDLTADEKVVEQGFQLGTYEAPLAVITTTLASDTPQVKAVFTPFGIDWRLVQITEAGLWMSADPVDRRQPVMVSTRLPWKDLPGGLHLSLVPLDAETGTATFDMGRVPLVEAGLQPLSFVHVTPGAYEVRAEYVSDDGLVVMPLDCTTLRVGLVTAKIEAGQAVLLGDHRVGWRGDLVISADGPVPDVTVQVGATLDKWILDTSSPVNHWTIATIPDGEVIALEHHFSLLDTEAQRLPIEAELPLTLGVEWPYRLWDAGLYPCVTSVAGSKTAGFTTTLRQYASERPEPGPTVRVMSYNIHIGVGMDGRSDLRRVADVIALADADIVGLQEVDVGVRRSSHVDQVKALANMLNMEAIHGPNLSLQGGQYGNAILSRYPIVHSQNILLPNTGNEPRGQLEATIDVGGTPLWFTVTHLSLVEKENALQRRFLVDRLRSVEEPFVVLGDFNLRAGVQADPRVTLDPLVRDAWLVAKDMSEPRSRLKITNTAGYTFSSAQPSRRIDYIFLSDEMELPHAQAVYTIDTQASDHLPLVAEIVWPPK